MKSGWLVLIFREVESNRSNGKVPIFDQNDKK